MRNIFSAYLASSFFLFRFFAACVLFVNANNVGTTPLLWFVNSGSGGDLREAHRSRDVPISPDEVWSRKGSERKTK